MAQAVIEHRFYSKEEYLALEECASYKSEYVNGEIFAMAGGSLNHSIICLNVNWAIREIIARKDCIGLESNVKVEIQRGKQYLYPDAMVVCGKIEFAPNRTDTITNPILIIEVLSPTTEVFDRNKKFAAYRTLPSLREYVLVYQDEPQIEAFFKEDAKTWRYTVARELDETIRLLSLECDLALREIYRKIVWEHPIEEPSEAE
jgi:Uma2 family endonuclease